jgi:hypothetical protein
VRKISLKDGFLTMLQVPASLVLCLCGLAEECLTHWLLVLENPLSHPMTDLAEKRAKTEQGATVKKDEATMVAQKVITPDHCRAFLAWLPSNNDYFIDRLRVHFEAKYVNLVTESRQRDPHLYAVLKPTRTENVMRISNIFRALPTAGQAKIIATALAVKPCSKRP